MATQTGGQIVFGTDGWRGIIAEDFTFANVRRVTRAIAQYLQGAYAQDRPVLIAYDTRFAADAFAQSAAEVLASLGWQVLVVDRDCPTPVIAYHAQHRQSAGALMFTASHNPAPYCGIKYIPDYAGPATPEITDAIVANIAGASDEKPASFPAEAIQRFDPKPEYLSYILEKLDRDRIRAAGLTVVYDALYSTSRGYLDTCLSQLNIQLTSLHTYRDVLFGGGMPEPKGEYLAELMSEVVTRKAAIGLATDGDSDRFGVVDENGHMLTPNTVLLVLARHLFKNKHQQGAIVRTVATTHLLDNLALQYGLELIETAVGFKYVGQKMREIPVLIGGEESGGLSVLGHIPEKDGVLADLLMVELIATEGKPLSQIVTETIAEAGGPVYTRRLDLHLTQTHKEAVLAHYHATAPTSVAGIGVKQAGRKDGLKLYLEDGSWVLIRPSGTEPLVRVYLEAPTAEKLNTLATAMGTAIDELA
ncbi:phosphoglucomutase/phosphomannomutase family protein [Candidatus Cyanaurora vandensis]|uniref:phosphoglucomutase/phosphomannomutase family protein n=1 Tax=Candidatus Cyanaurora vandensis TaxID=2714958 RepID=UPI00257ABEA7|nr:phosphoglucomutase/phosphomannomutase family protein [Candidatus Cyanaurora vandensis]